MCFRGRPPRMLRRQRASPARRRRASPAACLLLWLGLPSHVAGDLARDVETRLDRRRRLESPDDRITDRIGRERAEISERLRVVERRANTRLAVGGVENLRYRHGLT